MPMLEEKVTPEINLDALEATPAYRSRRQMLLALVLLLMALIVVLLKYREFWFPPESATTTRTLDQTTPEANPPKHHGNARGSKARRGGGSAQSSTSTSASMSKPITLNPLQVQVVSAGGRQSIRTQSASISVAFPDPSTLAPQSQTAEQTPPAAATEVARADSSEGFHLSPEAAKLISAPVSPEYPVLAKQMNVQGSVVLQALVEKDGNIQEVQVLSGPDILSGAAVEAVKQWHFKPYYQDGEPVQSQVEITVNFTISTH
jgi:TonB family protein